MEQQWQPVRSLDREQDADHCLCVGVCQVILTNRLFLLFRYPVSSEQQLQPLLSHLLPSTGASQGASRPAAQQTVWNLGPETQEHVRLHHPRGESYGWLGCPRPCTWSSFAWLSCICSYVCPLCCVCQVIMESSDSFRTTGFPLPAKSTPPVHSEMDCDQGALFQVSKKTEPSVHRYVACCVRV